MLNDTGKFVNERRNYHMSIDEFYMLLSAVKEHYNSKWYVFLVLQFSMGLRCEVCSAVNLCDFSSDFRYMDFRDNKTNKMIYKQPVPEACRNIVVEYVKKNVHCFKDGFLFSKHNGANHKGLPIHSTECIGAFWSKWRTLCQKKYSSDSWKEKYFILKPQYRILRNMHLKGDMPKFSRSVGIGIDLLKKYLVRMVSQGYIDENGEVLDLGTQYINGICAVSYGDIKYYSMKYRISSHSLRRLHRTTLCKSIPDDWKVAKLCHYQDMDAFYRYKNEFEIIEKSETLVSPIINNVISSAVLVQKNQTKLGRFI